MIDLYLNQIVYAPPAPIWAILENPALNHRLNPCFRLLYCAASRLGGYDSAFEYLMAGIALRGQLRIVAFQPLQHLACNTCGDLLSQWRWWLESDGRWTHVALSLRYERPARLNAVDPGCLERQCGAVLERMLDNLKSAAEKA